MRLRVGNQTSVHAAAMLPYQFALEHHFDAFEWFSDRGRAGWSEDLLDRAARAELQRTSKEQDLVFSVHAPYAADPVSPAGAAAIQTSIEFAAAVGARVVNVHLFPEHRARVFVGALLPLLRRAAAVNVQLSLENTPEVAPDYVNAVFGVLSATAEAPSVGLCFDMGHANLHAGTRNDYVGFVDLLGEHVRITHWHAHENWGDRDSHLTLFTGPAATDERGLRGLVRRLKQRKFAGSVVLEQWPSPPDLLVRARERLLRLWVEVA